MRTYTPYPGDYYQYGYGPEHLFFGNRTSVAPIVQSASAVGSQNPYGNQNTFVDAFRSGYSEAKDRGGTENQQSNDPGQNPTDILGTLATYGGNLLGFGLGPITTGAALGYQMASGKNPQGLGIMSALGLNPYSQNMTPAQYGIAVNNMVDSPLGQTQGSRSLDFFSGLNDLATVGQLGAVLDARDINRGDAPRPDSTPVQGPPTSEGQVAGGSFNGGDIRGTDLGGYDAGYGYQGDGRGYEWAQGGAVPGTTDGQSDKVEALLSHGEYVVDAPTVAAIGGGNTEAGTRKLDQMRKMVREAAFGTEEQPRPINFQSIMGNVLARR